MANQPQELSAIALHCCNVCQSLTCRMFWEPLLWKGTSIPITQC